jgi:hypothetical protein
MSRPAFGPLQLSKCKDVKIRNVYHKKPGLGGNTITQSSGMIHSP